MKTFVLFLLLFFFPACTAFKASNKFYYKYINPSPKLSLNNEELAQGIEYRFSQAIMPVDSPLASLLEEMSARDYRPDPAELEAFLNFYPWLSSAELLDSTGQVLAIAGEKSKAISELILNMDDPHKRSLRLLQGKDDHLVLLYPTYVKNTWEGFKAISFHPNNLLKRSPQSENLALFMEQSSLYCGTNFTAPEIVIDKLQTESAIHNCFKSKGKQYCWLRRNIGEAWLVYAYVQEN